MSEILSLADPESIRSKGQQKKEASNPVIMGGIHFHKCVIHLLSVYYDFLNTGRTVLIYNYKMNKTSLNNTKSKIEYMLLILYIDTNDSQ